MQTHIRNSLTCSLWVWHFAPAPSLVENRWFCWHLHQQGNALCSEGKAAECTSQGLHKRWESLKVQESLLLYSKTTMIPNKKSSWSSATVNQATLLGHWWFMWNLAWCPATKLRSKLVSTSGVFGRHTVQITPGIQTILNDTVLAVPPRACRPANSTIKEVSMTVESSSLRTPWTTLSRTVGVLDFKLYEFDWHTIRFVQNLVTPSYT